jgi:hypothetical protein
MSRYIAVSSDSWTSRRNPYKFTKCSRPHFIRCTIVVAFIGTFTTCSFLVTCFPSLRGNARLWDHHALCVCLSIPEFYKLADFHILAFRYGRNESCGIPTSGIDERMESRWNDDWEGTLKYSEKNMPRCHFSTNANATWTVLELKPAMRSLRITAWAVARPLRYSVQTECHCRPPKSSAF